MNKINKMTALELIVNDIKQKIKDDMKANEENELKEVSNKVKEEVKEISRRLDNLAEDLDKKE